MKNLQTFIALVLLNFNSSAAHLLGGQLWYENVGIGSIKVHLDLYREQAGTGLGTSQSITVELAMAGNIYSTTTPYLTLVTPEYPIQSNNCGGSYNVMVNHFEGIVFVPLNASIKLSYETCCRPFGITGLNNPSGEGFYLEAKINLENPNIRNFDNSIVPPQIGILRLRSGQINQVATPFTELDGDSVYSTLKPAKSNSTTNVVYSTGYTPTQPIHSNPNFPFTLTANFNGFSGFPTLNEISVISYRIDNYVTDTVTNTPFRIGYITADIPITVQSSTVSNQPISITPYSIGNSIGQLLVFSEPVYTNSIAQDLSEFELFANSIPITNGISNYTSSASQFGLLDSLNLHFAPNLTAGHYILHHKIGSDSTLCVGQCAQSSDDTMINITVPFPNAQITGHLSPYNSGFYKLSYANNIDSVRWSLANGTLNNSSSSTCTSAPSDSVFATLSASQCLLTAVRFGRGLTDTLSIQITPTGIGITENDLQYISAFPNPTNGIFQLNDVPLGSFDLVTREGRVIESGEIRKAYDISHLPNGVFSLRLRTAKGTQDIKIVKQ